MDREHSLQSMAMETPQMKFHTTTLSERQLVLLKKLGPYMKEHEFYLGGGTAIAIMLGHRKSVDLDWFTPEPIPDPQGLSRQLTSANIQHSVTSIEQGTLYIRAQGIRVSLMEYRYPLLRPFVVWKETDCQLASLDDLACMKLSTILQRGSKKDFIDIYALMKKHRNLTQLIKLYHKRYGADVAPVLYALNYFDDADKQGMPRMLWKESWQDIRKEILGEVRNSRP